MSDAELIDFATEFRKGILGRRSSHLMCAMVCWPLTGLLRFSGVPCETDSGDSEGGNHVWIALPDGRVLDPTADQFSTEDAPLPPVYLGEPLSIHQHIRPAHTEGDGE